MDRNSGRGRGKQIVRSIDTRDTAVEENDTFYVFMVNSCAYVMPINIEKKSVNMIVDWFQLQHTPGGHIPQDAKLEVKKL